MIALFALLAFAAQDPAASAADTQAKAEAAAAAKKADDDKPRCITRTKMGTRFKERICYDKAEYERRQLEERKALERIQRIPLTGN